MCKITLLISIGLVILVVFLFLRNVLVDDHPERRCAISLIGTFGGMYLLGYSLDNLSLMALTIGTGFVVDDAIVVIENITRHLERGMAPLEAALLGAKEIGFTVISISLSLVAVFIPILMMGRHCRPPFSRVRRHPVVGHWGLAAGFLDDHTDDVCAPAAVPRSRRNTGGCTRPVSACSRGSSTNNESSLAWCSSINR